MKGGLIVSNEGVPTALLMAAAAHNQDRPRRRSFLRRVFGLSLLAGVPAVVVAMVLLWAGPFSANLQWTLTVVVVLCWLGVSLALRRRVETPLRTLSNLLAALREGDYSVRARVMPGDDPLAEVMREANALIGLLREQRLGALEATALLRKIMEEIDVAIFAFDSGQRLRLVNRAGERLLALPAERMSGMTAFELGLGQCFDGGSDVASGAPEKEPEGRAEQTLRISFPGSREGVSRWRVSRTSFRQGGLPLDLLVLANMQRALREEELDAWRRLVRVLGHEINNSLAPIKSMAGTLESLVQREPRAADWEEDLRQGLRVIGGRAEALGRFTGAYASLARLPKPRFGPVNVSACVRRAAAMETRLPIRVTPGPEITVAADADQLDQLLINLLRNAADAALETQGGATVTWATRVGALEITVEDDGPGIANPGNLFVPFFTTKPAGAGIGLVLSRQIAEAHGGSLSLENRPDAPGAVARLILPLQDGKLGR